MRFARGDVRDHIVFTQKQPPTFISPLRRVAAVEATKNQLSRDFRCSSIFDFFNSIPRKQTWIGPIRAGKLGEFQRFSPGGLFGLNSDFLRMNQSHRSAP
jgi:hypothetical protein